MIYRFGDFAVRTSTRQVLCGALEVHLTPKGFDLLQLLLERRNRAVSKSEVHERLWPDTFVEETNVASLIAEIRRALADDASSPRFVRTIYGFGYQFFGEVREQPSVEALPRRWLIWESREIPLMEGENVIGRAADTAIQIDAPSISRRHARITVANGEAILEDTGSKNGTQVNGVSVSGPTRLGDGDKILVGRIALVFRAGSPADPTETVS